VTTTWSSRLSVRGLHPTDIFDIPDDTNARCRVAAIVRSCRPYRDLSVAVRSSRRARASHRVEVLIVKPCFLEGARGKGGDLLVFDGEHGSTDFRRRSVDSERRKLATPTPDQPAPSSKSSTACSPSKTREISAFAGARLPEQGMTIKTSTTVEKARAARRTPSRHAQVQRPARPTDSPPRPRHPRRGYRRMSKISGARAAGVKVESHVGQSWADWNPRPPAIGDLVRRAPWLRAQGHA